MEKESYGLGAAFRARSFPGRAELCFYSADALTWLNGARLSAVIDPEGAQYPANDLTLEECLLANVRRILSFTKDEWELPSQGVLSL